MNENDGIVIGRLADRFRATYWEKGEAVLWTEGPGPEEAVAALNEQMRAASATTQPVTHQKPSANARRGGSDEITRGRARTGSRTHRLSMIGRRLANAELVSHGFANIRNLYTHRSEELASDIYAERGGRRYWICVKARNKYAQDGKPNPCYRITQSTRMRLLKYEQDHPGTETACVAVSLVVSGKSGRAGEPPNSYSCYFSLLRDLTGVNGIGMLDQHLRRYECLALNKPIPSENDTSDLENG